MKLFLDKVVTSLEVHRPFVVVVGWMTKDDGTRLPNSTRLWMFFSPQQIKSFRFSHGRWIHVAQQVTFEGVEEDLRKTLYDREAEPLLLVGVHAEAFASMIIKAEEETADEEDDKPGGKNRLN